MSVAGIICTGLARPASPGRVCNVLCTYTRGDDDPVAADCAAVHLSTPIDIPKYTYLYLYVNKNYSKSFRFLE